MINVAQRGQRLYAILINHPASHYMKMIKIRFVSR
jgi:hypothetical protein